jgi:hypothetical protein
MRPLGTIWKISSKPSASFVSFLHLVASIALKSQNTIIKIVSLPLSQFWPIRGLKVGPTWTKTQNIYSCIAARPVTAAKANVHVERSKTEEAEVRVQTLHNYLYPLLADRHDNYPDTAGR